MAPMTGSTVYQTTADISSGAFCFSLKHIIQRAQQGKRCGPCGNGCSGFTVRKVVLNPEPVLGWETGRGWQLIFPKARVLFPPSSLHAFVSGMMVLGLSLKISHSPLLPRFLEMGFDFQCISFLRMKFSWLQGAQRPIFSLLSNSWMSLGKS